MLRYAGGADILSERLIEATARELCRYRRTEQCATLFARWQLDRPGSPRLMSTLAEMRQINRASSRELTPRKLRQLRMLYDGKVPDVKEAALAKQAARLTERFLLHYHHVVPFDRRVIEAAWERCRGDDCEDKQREAWQHLSSLDVDAMVLSESAAPTEHEETPPIRDIEEEEGGSKQIGQHFDHRTTE